MASMNIYDLSNVNNRIFEYLETDKDINYANNFKNIGLNPHTDGIPYNDDSRKNRIQSFLVTSNNINDDNSWSRTTIFIPESNKFIKLFHCYWLVYHSKYLKKCLSGKKIVKGILTNKYCKDCTKTINESCPQWFWRFNIIDFNSNLKKLYKYSQDKVADEIKIEKWWNILDNFEKESILNKITPDKFKIVKTNFTGGELVLFMPGIIHWVMTPLKGDKLYTKLFLELYTHNTQKKDDSEYTVDDGSFKQDARNFEKIKYINNFDNLEKIEQNLNSNDFIENLTKLELESVVNSLKNYGLVGIKFLNTSGNNNLQKDICNYLSTLLEFPQNYNLINIDIMKAIVNKGSLLNDLKLENKHLYRYPDASQIKRNLSSIFASSSGNTGLGAYSKVLKKNELLYNKLIKILDPIFIEIYGENVKLDCIAIGYQGSK